MEVTKLIDEIKTKQIKVEKERQEAIQKTLDIFFTGLDKNLEVTTIYENSSLFHMVLKTEIELNIATKADLTKSMAKLKESSAEIILDFETIKSGEDFKKDDL